MNTLFRYSLDYFGCKMFSTAIICTHRCHEFFYRTQQQLEHERRVSDVGAAALFVAPSLAYVRVCAVSFVRVQCACHHVGNHQQKHRHDLQVAAHHKAKLRVRQVSRRQRSVQNHLRRMAKRECTIVYQLWSRAFGKLLLVTIATAISQFKINLSQLKVKILLQQKHVKITF